METSAKSLIQGLLTKNSNTRLGMLHQGIKDIWQDPFFRGITLEQMERKAVPAPYL
jgi:hypothetical protein